MVVASFHLVRFAGNDVARRFAAVPFDRRALGRVPGLRFARLLGTGRGDTMTTSADLRRWAVFAVWDDHDALARFGDFGGRWAGAVERYDVTMAPLGAHGSWGGADPFDGADPATERTTEGEDVGGPVAVLTRATVRPRHLPTFLRAVPDVETAMARADGLLAAVGIGEVPVGRQATFSLWRDTAAVQAFAYRQRAHADVVERTRTEGWYGEEWFARLRPRSASGTWDGVDPLAGALA